VFLDVDKSIVAARFRAAGSLQHGVSMHRGLDNSDGGSAANSSRN
jgi:hypothetical protein